MRELTVRLKFTSHCLGNVQHRYQSTQRGKKKQKVCYLLPRSPDGRLILMPTWWTAILRKASDVFCKHQQRVKDIRFSMEVDGIPSPWETDAYRRYFDKDKFAAHEAFYPGSVIGVTCLVPSKISDDDFWKLLDIAGKYYGISPARSGEFGMFTVEGIQRRSPSKTQTEESVQTSENVGAK